MQFAAPFTPKLPPRFTLKNAIWFIETYACYLKNKPSPAYKFYAEKAEEATANAVVFLFTRKLHKT
jgi:hypothetical protein